MSTEGINLEEGVTYEEITGPLMDHFNASQAEFKQGFVRLWPFNQVFPREFLKYQRPIHEFQAKPSDIWVSSFPKCGTTWTQEMVWNIVNDLDFKTAKAIKLDDRVPFFELIGLAAQEFTDNTEDTLKKVHEMETDPRIIKTHLSYDMLPKSVMEQKAKVIYVTRNPRDTMVSYYNHWKVLEGYTGTLEDFAEMFVNDVCGYYTPFMGHVLGYWRNKAQENVLFITFEEMKEDLPQVIRRVSEFLGYPVKESKIPTLSQHLSFDSMKENKAVNKMDYVELCNKSFGIDSNLNGFMRTGQTGNWRTHFNPGLERKFEDWERKWLQGSDLKFTYDL